MLPYRASNLDCPVIRRSMARTFPRAPISVKEAQTPQVANSEKKFLDDARMETKPLNPNPGTGEGPPAWVLEDGSFICHAKAFRGRFPMVHTYVHGQGDPANYATSIMAAELALGMAFKGFLGT